MTELKGVMDPLEGALTPYDISDASPPSAQLNGVMDPLADSQVSPIDPESPMAKFMGGGGIVTGEGEAGPGTQAIASLPTDTATRAQYYAEQRFPNDPGALQRYGMQDGKIYYVDDQGQGHFEESEARLPTSIGDIPEAAAETGKAMAGSVGPALPVIGGTAAGVLTVPYAGGVPGAAAGGAAGDVVRQAGAYALTGEEKPVIDRLMQTGGAAVQEGAGQVAGLGIARGMKFAGRTPVYDLPASTKTGEMAKQFDIPLTAGERTASKSLIRRQKILGSTTEGEDIFENFYRMRNDKTRAAVYNLLDALSPEQSVRGASKAGVEGAQAAVGVERRALQRAAKPFYEQAEKVTDVNVQPVLDLIDDKIAKVAAPVAAKLRRIKGDLLVKGGDVETLYRGVGGTRQGRNFYSVNRDFAREFTKSGKDSEILTRYISKSDVYQPAELPFAGDVPAVDAAIAAARKAGKKAIRVSEGVDQPSSIFVVDKMAVRAAKPTGATAEGRLAKIDEVKKWLDDEIKSAGRKDSGIGTAQRHHLEEIRKLLVGQADEASEAYTKARGIYEAGMPGVAKIEKGIVGDVAKLDQNGVLRATRLLFSPRTSSAVDVRTARLAFNKAGKQAEWDALVRAHIQDTLESIPESSFGNPTNLGGTLFKSLYGSPKKMAMLREAMENSPGTLKDVEYFMQVLKATGRAAKGESITAFAQAGQKELAREAKPFLASAVESLEIWRTPSRVARFWADVSEGRYARKMSEILTSPEGIEKLKELRTLSPSSKGAIVGFTHLLTGGGVSYAGEAFSPDIGPGGFSGVPGNQPRP